MIVSKNRRAVEGLGDFFKSLGSSSVKVGKKSADKKVRKLPGALEIGANVSTAFASRSPKAALSSSPEVINVYHTGKRIYLGNFMKPMLNKWNKKHHNYIPLHIF